MTYALISDARARPGRIIADQLRSSALWRLRVSRQANDLANARDRPKMAGMAPNPLRDPDDDSRCMARQMLARMTHATLAVLDPSTGHPQVSRISCQCDDQGRPVALLSALAAHSRALAADPRAGLLVEGADGKGEIMTRPRLSMQVFATRLSSSAELRGMWLKRNPKAQIYVDLPDFSFWRLEPRSAVLIAGFGAAFTLKPDDLKPPQERSCGGA